MVKREEGKMLKLNNRFLDERDKPIRDKALEHPVHYGNLHNQDGLELKMYDDDIYESSFRPDSSYQYNDGVNDFPSLKKQHLSDDSKPKESVRKLRFNAKFQLFKKLVLFS